MPFHLVEYMDPLWRADYNYFAKNGLASDNYNGAKYKFFATSEREVDSYTRKGMSKVKKWVPQEPLGLLPLFDRETRDQVYAALGDEGKRAMDVAFPLDDEGQVFRVSEEDTTWADYAFLDELCRLGIADGYIIPAQAARNRVGAFHSEVGLCFAAFDSLKLAEITTKAPPAMPSRKRGRNNRNSNNANKNGNRNGTRKRRRLLVTPMFMNANNLPNN